MSADLEQPQKGLYAARAVAHRRAVKLGAAMDLHRNTGAESGQREAKRLRGACSTRLLTHDLARACVHRPAPFIYHSFDKRNARAVSKHHGA